MMASVDQVDDDSSNDCFFVAYAKLLWFSGKRWKLDFKSGLPQEQVFMSWLFKIEWIWSYWLVQTLIIREQNTN